MKSILIKDTTSMCSHLEKKLFEPEVVYHPINEFAVQGNNKAIPNYFTI